jgi:hypothetical protein
MAAISVLLLVVSLPPFFGHVHTIAVVQGIRNKTGEIIEGIEELRQDITTLTETKKKGNEIIIMS